MKINKRYYVLFALIFSYVFWYNMSYWLDYIWSYFTKENWSWFLKWEHIQDSSIKNYKLAQDSISSDDILNNTIELEKFDNSIISSLKKADNSIQNIEEIDKKSMILSGDQLIEGNKTFSQMPNFEWEVFLSQSFITLWYMQDEISLRLSSEYYWDFASDEYSSCSNSCWEWTMSRTLVCKDKYWNSVSSSNCFWLTQPSWTTISCNTTQLCESALNSSSSETNICDNTSTDCNYSIYYTETCESWEKIGTYTGCQEVVLDDIITFTDYMEIVDFGTVNEYKNNKVRIEGGDKFDTICSQQYANWDFLENSWTICKN